MPDPFDQMTEPLKQEGMTVENATLTAVNHQANVVGMYFATLRTWNIKPKDALALTVEWMGYCSEVGEEED